MQNFIRRSQRLAGLRIQYTAMVEGEESVKTDAEETFETEAPKPTLISQKEPEKKNEQAA